MSPVPLAAPPEHPRRLVYLGTPEMAVPPLRALHTAGFEIPLVITGPDRRRGRGSATSPSPVKAAATELGLEVGHDLGDALTVGADLGVVVAHGRIVPRDVLVELPMINLHFSLLPRWRGAAPVERAILAGDERTGVCVMAVEEGLDTGAVYSRVEVPIGERTTAADLSEHLTEKGADLLVDTLRDGLRDPEVQRGEPTYAAKIHPADRHLDWGASAIDLDRIVRIGGAWTTFRGRRFRILEAEPVDSGAQLEPGAISGDLIGTGAGALRPLVVQAEGRAATTHTDWSNGARPGPDERFGDTP